MVKTMENHSLLDDFWGENPPSLFQSANQTPDMTTQLPTKTTNREIDPNICRHDTASKRASTSRDANSCSKVSETPSASENPIRPMANGGAQRGELSAVGEFRLVVIDASPHISNLPLDATV